MSSLFNKLRALVNANLRGSRRYMRDPNPSDDAAEETPPLAEVTEAPAKRRAVPEVTEAPQVSAAPSQTDVPTSPPVSRIEEASKGRDQGEALEEERIVDLLKGDDS